MRRFALPVLASMLVGASMIPAMAQTTPTPTFRSERVYFTCAGDVKLQNYPILQGQYPGWSTTPPGSAALANGCGMYENNQNTAGLNLEFKGTFTGNLDNLTVILHNVYASESRPNGSIRMLAQLFVDEEELIVTPATNFPTSGTGPVQRLAYTFTGLNFDDEDGDGTQVHQVHVVARSSGTDTQSMWVWGASEVPAGLVFNPSESEAVTIPVDRP